MDQPATDGEPAVETIHGVFLVDDHAVFRLSLIHI